MISQHRFDPGLIELKRLLGDRVLGRLVLAEASTKWYRTQAYYDSAGWRGTWTMDGGSLMNQGIHYVDLLRWCMGPVTEVTAVCATQAHQVEVEDTALAIVGFGSGAVGTILSSTAAYPGFPQRLEITGTDGVVWVPDLWLPPRRATFEIRRESKRDVEEVVVTGEDQIVHMLEHFDRAVLEGRPVSPPPEEAVRTLRVLDALARSAREGREVAVEGDVR